MSFCVNLEHRSLKAGDIIALARDFKSSRHELVFSSLKLSYNCLGDPGAGVIASYLGEDYSITSLDLCFNGIGDAGIEAIARSLSHNGSLKVLYLSGNSVSPKGFKYLSSALAINSCLTSLHLTGNSGEEEGTAAIAAALRVNRSVSALCLNGNKIGSMGCRHLSETLACNDTLQVLMLSDNEIGDAGAICLGRALRFHKFLQVLELSFNKITAVGIEELCRHFSGYVALRKLQLDNNKMGDKGLKMLARVIASMQLKELNVGFNDVGPEGAVALLEAVSPNRGLLALNISGCAIKSEGALLLATLLRGDMVLQELYLDRANIGAGGERNVSMGIATNRKLALRILTGFHLGRALVQLGSPNRLASMSNEATLKYLTDMWAAKLVDGSSAVSSSSVKSHEQQSMNGNSYSLGGDREAAADGHGRGRNGHGHGKGREGSRSGGRDGAGAASTSMDRERRETDENGGSDSRSSSSGGGGVRQGAHAQTTPQSSPKPHAPTPLSQPSATHAYSQHADPIGVGRHVEEAGPVSGRTTEPTFESIGMVSFDSSDLLGIFDGDTLSWEDAAISHSSRRAKSTNDAVSNVSNSNRKVNVQRGADDTVYSHFSDAPALAEAVPPLSPTSTQGQGPQRLGVQECEAVATMAVAIDSGALSYSHFLGSEGSEGGRGECSYCESRMGMGMGMGRIEQSKNEDPHSVSPLASSSPSSSSSSSSTTTKSSIQLHQQLMTIDRGSESSPFRKGNVELSLAKDIVEGEGKGEPDQGSHGHRRFQSSIMSNSLPLPYRAEHFASAQSPEPTLEIWDPSTLGAVEHAAIRDTNVPDFVLRARDLGKIEYQPADLWELHQHFFSPPQSGRPNSEGSCGSLEENGASSGSGSDTDGDEGAGPAGPEAGHSSGLDLEQHLRQRGLALGVLRPRRPAATGGSKPRKRPRNRRTLARIMFYPRVQRRLESLKTEADSPHCLTLLRQLRYLEEHCRSELRDLNADLEDVLLNLVDGH